MSSLRTFWCCDADDLARLSSDAKLREFAEICEQASDCSDPTEAAEVYATRTISCAGEGSSIDVAVATDRYGAGLIVVRVSFSLRLHARTEVLHGK
jgi:hypothetical protein